MEYNEIVERVIEILEEFTQVNPDSIGENSSLGDDLGIKSIKIIDIIFELEEEFDIQFSDGAVAMEKFKTVKTIAENVYEKVNTES